jgi:hypothetical protein
VSACWACTTPSTMRCSPLRRFIRGRFHRVQWRRRRVCGPGGACDLDGLSRAFARFHWLGWARVREETYVDLWQEHMPIVSLYQANVWARRHSSCWAHTACCLRSHTYT